ncbi:lycopene cyclase domain-containing protein [Flavobacteriaceae bacterium MAR_2010_105]|nr:lycopene cyclase domain-containing protein [Flavobacteriaceae bacterium MAR_2010_105]
MNYLYLMLNIGSFAIPFLFSFHPKLKFYAYWKGFIIATVLTMLIFIPWDIIFTINGIWGFNESYFLGNYLFSLPIEEWLFFICIPYACVFTHYALLQLFPGKELDQRHVNTITHTIMAILVLLCFLYYDKWYTFINFLYALILLMVVKTLWPALLKSYYLTFLVMLIPFFIVNGILTGSAIENEVVWYNNDENLNFRIFTIPVEDMVYAFTLILTNLSLTQYFYKKLN